VVLGAGAVHWRGVRRVRVVFGAGFLAFVAMSSVPMAAWAIDESEQGVERSTQYAVFVVTVLALTGAALAARRILNGTTSAALPFRSETANIDLLATRPAMGNEPPIVGVFETLFLAVLLLYALFDRAFAWVHIPGTPAFVGEITVLFGVLAMMATRAPVATAIRKSPPLKALLAWMGWGFLFLVVQLPAFGLDAIRDSALWYYGIVAIFVVFLLLSDPTRFGRWADAFGRVLPFLLVWFLIAMVLDSLFGASPPYVPDSEIPIFGHRFGNIAVLSGVAIGFIWLVDRERGRYSSTQRIIYTVLGGIGILVAGFQNRGGMVSAVLGIVAMLLFLRRRRGELILVLASVVITLATVAIVTEVRIPVSSGREISAAQMIDNINSVINPESGGERQTETTQWRLNLWTAVVDDVTSERPLNGWGPGPNLGVRYGVSTNEEVPLRNPHNSHVGILARMGWVGIGLWAILWIVWSIELLQLRSWLRHRGRSVEAGVVAWLLVTVLMILVNAIFDPTLEGPQVGMWLWCCFGIGAAMMLVYSGVGTGVSKLIASSSGNPPAAAVDAGGGSRSAT